MKKTKIKYDFARQRDYLLFFYELVVALVLFLFPLLGCCHSLKDVDNRATFIPKVQSFEKNRPKSLDTELVLSLDDRVERIALSSDRKRLILETRHRLQEQQDGDYTHDATQLNVGLWNIEFADARPEAFSGKDNFLVGNNSGIVAFDTKGERLFWLDQKNKRLAANSLSDTLQDTIVRGAVVETSSGPEGNEPLFENISLRPLPLYLPWEEEDGEGCNDLKDEFDQLSNTDSFNQDKSVETLASKTQSDAENSDLCLSPEKIVEVDEDVVQSAVLIDSSISVDDQKEESLKEITRKPPVLQTDLDEAETLDQRRINVVMTKTLESDAFLFANVESDVSLTPEAKRLKTALVTKKAEDVWFSPSAKWLVCHLADKSGETLSISTPFSSKDAESDARKESIGEESVESEFGQYSNEWALVPVRDRRRVVRFPENIKTSFDSSISDEEIYGRVVDVLAVSDSEDLVATLVEEQAPNPRYKIVIWDLNVALTIDIEKAYMPLRAIEVCQITLPHPVSRKYCKFSPSGKSFAARVDPHYVSVWQSTNGRPIVELGEHAGIVHDFDFSPSETKMAVGTGDSDSYGEVFLWEIRKGVAFQVLDSFPHSVKSVDAVAFSSNDRYVYFATDLGEIRRWDIRPKVKRFD